MISVCMCLHFSRSLSSVPPGLLPASRHEVEPNPPFSLLDSPFLNHLRTHIFIVVAHVAPGWCHIQKTHYTNVKCFSKVLISHKPSFC